MPVWLHTSQPTPQAVHSPCRLHWPHEPALTTGSSLEQHRSWQRPEAHWVPLTHPWPMGSSSSTPCRKQKPPASKYPSIHSEHSPRGQVHVRQVSPDTPSAQHRPLHSPEAQAPDEEHRSPLARPASRRGKMPVLLAPEPSTPTGICVDTMPADAWPRPAELANANSSTTRAAIVGIVSDRLPSLHNERVGSGGVAISSVMCTHQG